MSAFGSFQVATEFIKRQVCEIKELRGKPKFFTFQCCQGDVREAAQNQIEVDRFEQPQSGFTSPMEDVLILYATIPGYVSYR